MAAASLEAAVVVTQVCLLLWYDVGTAYQVNAPQLSC